MRNYFSYISLKTKWLNSRIVGTVLIIKFLLLSFGIQAYQIVTDQPIKELYW